MKITFFLKPLQVLGSCWEKNGIMPKDKIASKPKAKVKPHSRFNYAYMYSYLARNPKCFKKYGKTNPKGPRKI